MADQHATKSRALRRDIIEMLYRSQSGHPGGSLSCVEILQALYYEKMNVRPREPRWEGRDRFVLSKGHACPALYAILADLGFFPREDLWHLRQMDSHLQGHPDSHKTPGVDVNTGSLGQGMAIAAGMALAGKRKAAYWHVYCLIGDGEMQEGLIWEAAMSSSHYGLDNFTVLLDYNGLQIDGSNDDVMSLGDVMAKFAAFGFACVRADGHDMAELLKALNTPHSGKPLFIACDTHKGQGVSFMKDQFGWHGKAPNEDEYKKAMKELED